MQFEISNARIPSSSEADVDEKVEPKKMIGVS
jgi:hypothetical protein